MKNLTGAKIIAALAITLGILSFAASRSIAANEYKFKVVNKTDATITKLFASENGKKWGSFDIGKGIRSGATMELVWDQSTDNSGCEWWFKAHFADGSDSEPVKFDFCEDDLVLEFK
jgi:hypothetical protein